MVRQLVVPAFVVDTECRVLVWNQACERLTGMPAAEVIGTRDHWRAFYPEPRPCLADLIAQGRLSEIERLYLSYSLGNGNGNGTETHAENWCLMPLRGTQLCLAIDAGPIRDANGRIVAAIETLRDMTQQKLAESALRLTASVFENSQEGIVITDPQSRILEVNSAFSRLTGYSHQEAMGQTPAMLKSGLHDTVFYQEMWRRLRESGQWQGEVWNRRKSGQVYPEILHINAVKNGEGAVTHYIGMFIDITDLKNTQQRLESLANYDALTDLPNRVLLAERLHRAMAKAKNHERLVAVCFLDLDDFKLVNDFHGHETGDRFLVEIAKRLLASIRPGDTVARLGGDEFVLLLTDLVSADDLEHILGRIFDAVSKPFRLDGIEIGVSLSVGVTLYPLDDSDPDTLLRHADQSMYQAKQLGRNRYQLFDLEAEQKVQTRHRELERIRQALQHGEFRLHYQPKVNMRTGEIIGVEALIRWQHPERGLLSPAAFLPTVEQSSLIVDIGEWVLHEALAQVDLWSSEGRPMAVSVNIAARHFQHIDFVARLKTILAEHPRVSPQLLELEILESAAIEDVEMMREVMASCQAIGVSFALDDFGTGYSSLSYLKQLPAETLKIDQSFVSDMLDEQSDFGLIEGVISLANVFRKRVIAEGVETPEHGLVLMRFGCDCAQGYGIGYPMPAQQVTTWMDGFEPDWKWDLWAKHQWDGLDMPLLLSQYDHVKWVERVVRALDDPVVDLEQGRLLDATRCRFGTWHDHKGRQSYGDFPEFVAIGPVHRRMHDIGAEMIRLRDSGELTAARARLDEFFELEKRVLAMLQQLQARVAIYRSASMPLDL